MVSDLKEKQNKDEKQLKDDSVKQVNETIQAKTEKTLKPENPSSKTTKQVRKKVKKSEDAIEEEIIADLNDNKKEGTDIEITEEIIDEEKIEGKPVSVPKGSRRGNKAVMIELEKTKELAKENEDKYKRLLAEFENARQRNEKESSRLYDYGSKDVLEKLLPVIDNFERAIGSITENEKESSIAKGVELIFKQMIEVMTGVGVRAMEATGQSFNPEFHNAVMHIEDETLGENVVVEEMQKGYMYKDQVLRYSMVKVAN